ncbi:hypothetical protein [Streptomyces sp. NPDC005004]
MSGSAEPPREPDTGHDDTPTHAGNGTVKHGPEGDGRTTGEERETPTAVSATTEDAEASEAVDAAGTREASGAVESAEDSETTEDSEAPEAAETVVMSKADETPSAAKAPGSVEKPDDRPTRVLPQTPDEQPAKKAPADSSGDGLAELAALTGLSGLPGLDDLGGPQDVETGLGSDELALRRLLHSAVDDIAPRDGSLDRLRHAVPARRARKRQAAVGMAAAALFLCTAVPALVHVSNAGGTDPNTAMAGQSSDAQGSQGKGRSSGGATEGTGGQAGTTAGQHGKDGDKGERGRKHSGGAGSTGGADPSATLASGGPACTAGQLSATAATDAPDSSGVVYGTFRVTNTSGTACTVTGTGYVGASAQGAADPAKVATAMHVPGDAAAALPAPGLIVSTLVLQPGASYAEKFGFVPSETCPVQGGATGGTGGGDPTPDPTPTGGQDGSASGGAENTGTEGVAPQLVADGAPADGSVLVTYSGVGGTPSASATVPNACAGTVYFTGMVPGA